MVLYFQKVVRLVRDRLNKENQSSWGRHFPQCNSVVLLYKISGVAFEACIGLGLIGYCSNKNWIIVRLITLTGLYYDLAWWSFPLLSKPCVVPALYFLTAVPDFFYSEDSLCGCRHMALSSLHCTLVPVTVSCKASQSPAASAFHSEIDSEENRRLVPSLTSTKAVINNNNNKWILLMI